MVSRSESNQKGQSNKSINPKSINRDGQKDSVDLIKFAEDIINRLSSEQIYNLYNHEFQADGNGKLRGKPPFRESFSGTSFTVYPDKGFFDAGGNFSGSPMDYIHSIKIGYYERAKGKDWVNALKELANIANIEFPNKSNNSDKAQKWINRQNILSHAYEYLHHALLNPNNPNSVKAIEYLHGRGINDETIKTIKIGFYDSWAGINNYLISKGFTPDEIKAVGLQRGKFITKDGLIDSKNSCTWVNFITFPWLDVNGNPLSLYGRYFEKKPPNTKTPKTLALPGSHTKKHPFLFYICKENNHKEVIFVEGLFDAIVLHQSGITNVCSGIGASFSNEQIDCLVKNKIESVTNLGDPDGGGENGTKSNLKRLLKKEIDVFVPERLPDGLDPDEFLIKYGIDDFKDRISKAEHGLVWLAKDTVNQFDSEDNNYFSQVLRKASKIKREYDFLDKILWYGYYQKTLIELLGINADEFKINFEVENENLEQQLIDNKAYVGIKSGNPDVQLYASYCSSAEDSGTKAVAMRRFSNLLGDLFNNQLNIPIKKYRDSRGAYFMDIAVRSPADLDELLITGNYNPDDDDTPPDDGHNGGGNIPKPTPPTPPPPPCNTFHSEVVTHNSTQEPAYCENISIDFQNDGKNDGKMMAESTGSVESDGSDGKIWQFAPKSEKSNTDHQKRENSENSNIYQHNSQPQDKQEVQPSHQPKSGNDFREIEAKVFECLEKPLTKAFFGLSVVLVRNRSVTTDRP